MTDEPRKSTSWPWRSATLLLLLAVYVGGYFVLANGTSLNAHTAMRIYRSSIAAHAYAPLAKLESVIFNRTVYLSYPGERPFDMPMLRFAPERSRARE